MSRLIAILDELDMDPEGEPWLASPENNHNQRRRAAATHDNREEEVEHGVVDQDGFAEQWGGRGVE